MWIISRDSHIYMQRFVLHLHHVILTSSYTEDNERLLYEIHFTMTTFTVLANEHFSFCRLPLALVYRSLDKTLLKCCHVYIFITRFNFRNNFFRIVLHFGNEYFFFSLPFAIASSFCSHSPVSVGDFNSSGTKSSN